MDDKEMGLRMQPGTLVEVVAETIPEVDLRGEECILVRREPAPEASWLKLQHDPRMQASKDSTWWAAMPLSGGLLLVPESILRVVRRASYDDVMNAVDHADESGRRTIAALFPEFVAEAAQRLSGQ